MSYQCANCKEIFGQLTQDGLCPKSSCNLEPLIPCQSSGMANPSQNNFRKSESQKLIEGVCILVCDISGSMDEPAFADHPITKLSLVASAVKSALAELRTMGKADSAYVGIIAFGATASLIRNKQGRPFLMSVADINQEFADSLGEYLLDYFQNDRANVNRGGTDISAALQLAFDIYNGATKGNLSQWGVNDTVTLMDHNDILMHDPSTGERRQISVPNGRVLIYSDGMHTSGNLANPFSTIQHSPLMTAFLGDESASPAANAGADQMKGLAVVCPEHGHKGYFLINQVQRHAILRGLFRMASGASGFCPQCLKKIVGSSNMAD